MWRWHGRLSGDYLHVHGQERDGVVESWAQKKHIEKRQIVSNLNNFLKTLQKAKAFPAQFAILKKKPTYFDTITLGTNCIEVIHIIH